MAAADETGDFDAAMRALGVGDAGEAWRAGWQASQASYPAGGPAFLREQFVRDVCGRLGVAADVCQAVVASLEMLRANEALSRLAWHCHATLFGAGQPDAAKLNKVVAPWPAFPDQLPPWGEMFYAPVLLSGGPFMIDFHRRRGIDMAVTRATAGDLELWMRHCRRQTGRWGLAQTGWLMNHFLGRIYRLGRVQFRFEEFAYDFRAYRSRADGRVVLLAPGGARFRADGQFDGASGVSDPSGAWTSVFVEDGGTIRGNPVSPDGRAIRQAVELPAGQWEPALRQGDPVLGVHIPAGEPMAHEACGRSFRWAMEFLPRHFPERPFRAFQCTSWFLDNQFGRLLPADSNIRRFQEEVHLFPLPDAGDWQTFERVFARKYDDVRQAPRDTALRRAVADHVLAGGHFHAGGCVLLPQDIDWGRKVYRRRLDDEC